MHGFGLHGFGWILWLLIVAGILYGVFYIVRQNRSEKETSAQDILRRRFAAGEISSEEFVERLNLLMNSNDEGERK